MTHTTSGPPVVSFTKNGTYGFAFFFGLAPWLVPSRVSWEAVLLPYRCGKAVLLQRIIRLILCSKCIFCDMTTWLPKEKVTQMVHKLIVCCLATWQGCALRKIEGSPVLWSCEIQGAQHRICMKKLRFSSCPWAKVRHQVVHKVCALLL